MLKTTYSTYHIVTPVQLLELMSAVLLQFCRSVYRLFSDSHTDGKRNRVGIQLLGVMLANGLCPYEPSTSAGVTEERSVMCYLHYLYISTAAAPNIAVYCAFGSI